MIEAAQEAAAAGDYPAAERLLREAASIQEATLGSMHPDLASTLNNLAFVCERTNNIVEAERGYRRAHAIAVASLGPRDPFVATSIKNLVGFCETHGIPIWRPPSVQPEAETAEPDGETQSESSPDQQPVAVASRAWLTVGVTTLAIALVAVVLMNRRVPEAPPPASAAAPSVTPPAPAREVQPAVVEESPRPAPKIAPPQPVTVVNAQLCTALVRNGSPDWQCARAGADLQPGTLFFYTRLLTQANTTVEHRWYRGERVHQVMKLRVAATPGSGYRTFSSNTVSAERAGDWKVELRAADGTVLQEQRFAIRVP